MKGQTERLVLNTFYLIIRGKTEQTISPVRRQFNHPSWSKYQFRLSVSISCQAEGVNPFNNCAQKVILASLCILAGLKKLRYLILAEKKRLFMGVIASAILPVAGRCVACVLASSIMYRYRSIELSHSCQFPHLTHGLCNIHSHESHLLPSRSRTDRTGGLPEFADEISHGKRDERWMRKSIRLTSDCSSRNS